MKNKNTTKEKNKKIYIALIVLVDIIVLIAAISIINKISSSTDKKDTDNKVETNYEITATFIYPKGDNENSKQVCTIYDEENKCKIKFPSYKTIGTFENSWSDNKNLNGKIYKAGEEITINKNTTFYASYHHPYYSDNENNENYYEDRNLKISRIINIGSTRFEYENGIPEKAINEHVKFINEAYKTTPWIFTPAKVFVLTSETYKKVSIAYGLTFGENSYNYIDIQYDPEIDAISDNATIHELARAWDFYYGFKTGTNISEQKDIIKLYDSLTPKQRKELSIVEWFAGTSTEYYWHYLKKNTTKESYAGFKEFMTTEQQKEYVKIYEKYANIAKKGYKQK